MKRLPFCPEREFRPEIGRFRLWVMTQHTLVSEIPGLAPAVGPYSVAVRAGNSVFVSGQLGLDPATGKLVEGGVEAEAKQMFANVATILSFLKLSHTQIVKTTLFLADMADFKAVNEIYATAFGSHRPARSTIQVAALPLAGRVEMEFIVVE
jgi:2-iminobutanoate/2-iminopropanoate deaminase